MVDTPCRLRALVIALLLPTALLALPASAAVADCGGGEVELLQGDDVRTVVGVRLTGIDAACDGQPVGVQFLGNAAGDPTAPADELSHAYSDEDPCTGDERPDGVLRQGAVDVLLCDGSVSAPHVDGRQLTSLRLLTTAGTSTLPPPGVPDPPGPAPGGDTPPLPAPAPPAGGHDLPLTGADILQALLLGGVLVVAGGAVLRRSRTH